MWRSALRLFAALLAGPGFFCKRLTNPTESVQVLLVSCKNQNDPVQLNVPGCSRGIAVLKRKYYVS